MTPNFISFDLSWGKTKYFMVLSMTGFGSGEKVENGFSAEAEIKCLNSKYLDLTLRLPKALNSKESEIRSLIQKELVRGKVNLVVDWRESANTNNRASINQELLQEYYKDLKSAAEKVGDNGADLFKIALGMPDVVDTKNDEETEKKWEISIEAIKEALKQVNEFRKTEGANLINQLEEGLNKIVSSQEIVRGLAKERTDIVKEKLRNSLNELKDDHKVDENRFEQELIYYLEKLDIEEEMVRLKSHVDHFREILAADSNGKRLNFIAQEMGREINTLGAKANHAQIQKSVVDMKEELEKIREQVQNIL